MGWTDAPIVEGGKWASAPAVNSNVVMETADGRIIRNADGKLSFASPSYATNDPTVVKKIMEGASVRDLAQQSWDEDILAQAPIAARGQAFLRGIPLVGSYLDELYGTLYGPEAKTASRAVAGAMERQNPIESGLLGLAGGVAGTAPALLAAPAAIPTGVASRTLPAVASGLGLGASAGAIEGAVYGAGEATEGNRLQGARTGAAIGAATGGLLGAATPLVAKGVRNVAGLLNRSDVDGIARELGISKDAAKVIRNVFDQGGDIEAARGALLRAGDEGMLADAGYAAQAMLDAAAASGGQAGQIVRDAVDGRMVRTGRAVDAALDATLGPTPLGPKTALDAISAKSAPARSEAYRAAYGTAINYASDQGRNIESVLRRIEPDVLMAGVREANANMKARGETNRQIMAMLGDNGEVVFRELPNVEQLDEIKKAMQAIAYGKESNPITGKLTSTGQRYNTLANELRDAVSSAVPDYGTAVSLGGDKLAEDRAFMMGRGLLNSGTEIEDVLIELGPKPSVDQIAAAKQGLRSQIAKTLGDVRAVASDPNIDARQVVKAVTDMSSDNARKKIRALLGKEADALLAEIDKAAQSALVRASVATNSKTAVRGAVQGQVDEITSPSMIGQFMQGEPIDTTKAMVQAITGQTAEYTATQKQQIYADIAKALTEKKGASARAALNYIDKAMKGQPLTTAQNEFVAQQVAGALFATATPQSTRAVDRANEAK